MANSTLSTRKKFLHRGILRPLRLTLSFLQIPLGAYLKIKYLVNSAPTTKKALRQNAF